MNIRSLSRLSSIIQRNAFSFSQDPFNKFNKRQNNKTSPKKPLQPSPQKKNSPPTPQTPQSSKQHIASKVTPQQDSLQDISKKNNLSQGRTQPSDRSGFERFSNKKREEAEEPSGQASEINENKRDEIPKIKLDMSTPEEDKTVIRLRRPKQVFDNNKVQRQKQQNEEEEKKGEKDATEEERIRWQRFDSLLGQKKKVMNTVNSLRFDRLSLQLNQEPSRKSNDKKEEQGQPQPSDLKTNLMKLVAAGLGLMLVSSSDFGASKGTEVSPHELQEALLASRVEKTWVNEVEIESNNDEGVKGKNIHRYIYTLEKDGTVNFCPSNRQFQNLWFQAVQEFNREANTRNDSGQHPGIGTDNSPHQRVLVGDKVSSNSTSLISNTRTVLSLILLYFFVKSISQLGKAGRGKGKGGGGLSMFENQKSYRIKQSVKVTFKDVVGMQKAKDEIVEFIDFLKAPEKYTRLGARIPKGALLTGPPGTGKTMIAKACAGESNVPFFTISGSEFIEMYVGVGAQRVRNIFKEAKENSPSIIFIDEIDAVGKKRTGGLGGNDERDTTLNQLLVQMDGFDNTTNVIIFAATNQKEVLDAALTRPGRFDRLIDIDLPDLHGRSEIFKVHLKPLLLDAGIQVEDYSKRLATLTPGFSGADIKNVCNEAAIIAARGNKEVISISDFEMATERIIGGVEKKSQLITEETRRTVSFHECGHGVVSWFLEHSNPLLKLTIIPRSKGALGFAQYLPSEHQMYTRAKLLDEICVILGGRVAEELFFGKISTGASDDLRKAYQLAKDLVTQYGFGEELGWLRYSQTQYAKEYGEDIENQIDAEIASIMKTCTAKTRSIIEDKKDSLRALAEKLLEAETIDQTIIEHTLGPRPFALSREHQEYVWEKRRMSEESKAEEKTREGGQNSSRASFTL